MNRDICPYCQSSNIEAGNFFEESMTLEISCRQCKEVWYDVLKFSHQEDYNGEDLRYTDERILSFALQFLYNNINNEVLRDFLGVDEEYSVSLEDEDYFSRRVYQVHMLHGGADNE